MKNLIFPLITLIVSAVAVADTCPNLNGSYQFPKTPQSRYSRQMTLIQTDCAKLDGSVKYSNGTILKYDTMIADGVVRTFSGGSDHYTITNNFTAKEFLQTLVDYTENGRVVSKTVLEFSINTDSNLVETTQSFDLNGNLVFEDQSIGIRL
jgi:hypothetical protein